MIIRILPFSGTYLPLIVPIDGQNMPTHISNTTNAMNMSVWLFGNKIGMDRQTDDATNTGLEDERKYHEIKIINKTWI